MSHFGNPSRFAVAAILFVAFSLPAFAQRAELDALADRVAQKISQKKKHVVVVADFTLAYVPWTTPIGSMVAAEFVSSLRRAAPVLRCMDHSTIANGTHRLNVLPEDKLMPDVILALGKEEGAEVGVTASLFPIPGGLRLEMQLSDLKSSFIDYNKGLWRKWEEFEVEIPLRPEWEAVLTKRPDTNLWRTYPVSRQDGDSRPECIQCPHVELSPDVRKSGVEGSVVLLVTVNSAGSTQDMLVIRHPGDGLPQAAVDTVRYWKYKPARRHDGTPVPIRMIIIVHCRRRY